MRSSINGMGTVPPPSYNVTKTGASRPMPTLSNRETIIEEPETMRSESLKKPLSKINASSAYNMTKTGPGVTSNLESLSSGILGINTTEETFSLELQTSIDPLDPAVTTLWEYTIPSLASNEKQLILNFIGGEVLLLQVASSDFPQEIFIYCDQISGYQDKNGNPTNVIAIFRMKNVFSMVFSGVTTYTILYEIKDCQSWPLGLTRTLTFSAGDRTGTYNLPLTSPLHVEFKILHVAY